MTEEKAIEIAESTLRIAPLPKAVVAFAGARDGYQLPLALSEANLLEALVTDMYWPADRKWFSLLAGKLLPENVVRSRFSQELNSSKVRISSRAWAVSTSGYFTSQSKLKRYGDKSLGRKARSLALQTNASVFCCSYYASEAFKEQRERPVYRFLFQLHPHPLTVRTILSDEIRRTPFAKCSLLAEPDLGLSKKDFQELSSEPHLANGWVVASSYTAKTLSEHGIPLGKIHVIPYGVDSTMFPRRVRPPDHQQPFTIIYLGSLIQRKGLSYLLDAVRMLGTQNLRVALFGRGLVDEDLISRYSDLRMEINIGLPRERVISFLHKGDVLVLPSLAEGFAHVILEAMSCGLPVIATPHTCAPDVLTEGLHGFIVPIRNAEALAEKISWGIDHRTELAEMGEAAAQQAGLFTWLRFRNGIKEAYKKMVASIG